MDSAQRNFLLSWLPALAWTCIVFIFSTNPFSAAHTGIVLRYILQHTVGPVSAKTFAEIHLLVRKGAHVTVYGILGVLYFRAFRGPAASGNQLAWMRQAIAVAMLIAGLDEFHQSFLPSRTSEVTDVLLDTAAAAIFIMIFALAGMRRGRASTA
jgi:VanZ family protein